MSVIDRYCRQSPRHPADTQQSNHRSRLFESNLRFRRSILNQYCSEIPSKSFFDSIDPKRTLSSLTSVVLALSPPAITDAHKAALTSPASLGPSRRRAYTLLLRAPIGSSRLGCAASPAGPSEM